MEGDINNPNDSPVPKEARDRMVKDALAEFYNKHNPAPVTPVQIISHRAQLLHQKIWTRCQQRLTAIKQGEAPFHKQIEEDQLFKEFIDEFRVLDKDQLLYIFAQINAEFMCEKARDWYDNL